MPLCGIAGFCLSPNEKVNARRLSASLLFGIESRGYDATGAAWFKPDGNVESQRAATPARRFIKDTLSVPRNAQTVVLHTRFSTQGSELNNLNNHPIRVGPLVGVHNGVLNNDDHLFWMMDVEDKRQAEVDSEAIWAALFYGPQVCDGTGRKVEGVRRLTGLKSDHPSEVLSEIEGSAAVAWLDERDPHALHLGRCQYSPLVWAQSEAGSLVFASSLDAIEESADLCRMKLADTGYLSEGTYVRVLAGATMDLKEFKPARTYSSVYSSFSRGRSDYTSAWDKRYDDTTVIGPAADTRVTTCLATKPIPDSWLASRLDVEDEVKKDTAVHFHAYKKREVNIDSWMEGVKGGDQTAVKLAFETKAFARKGGWIVTDLNGEDVYGQIYEMPESFPGGWYVLKLMVHRSGDYEAVLVRRQHSDFDLLHGSPAKALPEATTTDDFSPVHECESYDEAPTMEQLSESVIDGLVMSPPFPEAQIEMEVSN